MINIDKISRIIIQPVKNLILKIHVRLYQNKDGKLENYHNEFTFNNKKFVTLNPSVFLSLAIIDKEDWDKSKSIMINQRNIYQIIKNFRILLKNIYRDEIFAMDSKGKNIIYSDMADKYTQKIYNLGMINQRLIIKPSIVFDENDVSYEGVIMYINNSENFVELPIDAFESLYYTLEKMDIFAYSQQLLNYYVSCLKTGEEMKDVTVKTFRKHPLNIDINIDEVKGSIFKTPTAKDFFNI